MDLIIKIIQFILSLFDKKGSSFDDGKEDPDFELEDIKNIPEEETEVKHISKNNSKPEDYYKQTNNEIDPFISCFPTSMINAAAVLGIVFPKDKDKTGGYVQPEDQYNWYLEHDEGCRKFWSKPEFAKYLDDPANHPRELWEVEVYCFNRWIGRDVCKYVPNVKIQQIIDLLNKGGTAVTSGKFCEFGHVVAVVGFKADSVDENNVKESEVTQFIVDDSYGNPHNNYKPVGVDGNDVEWEKDKFLAAINKGREDKPSYNAILFGNV